MKAQELNDLVDWFKNNVMNVYETGEVRNNLIEHSNVDNSNKYKTASGPDADFEADTLRREETDESLTLLEYIIGIAEV